MIEFKHLYKEYDDTAVLKDFNAVINDGDVVSLIGPSGCGKSTLLRCATCLEELSSGQIFIDGEEITAPGYDTAKAASKTGMVFQHWNLFAHWTVIQNIVIPQMRIRGRSKQEAYDKAARLLNMVGLSDKMLAYPSELSGGQQQRAAIARTLGTDPDVILLDEPTSSLDQANVGEVEEVIKSLAQSGRTMIVTTHELEFAREISNRIFFMDGGVVVEEGTPEQVLDHPRHSKTRRFIRRLKTVQFDIDSEYVDLPALVGSIRAYCVKNGVSEERGRHLQAALEELCMTILRPVLPQDDKRIHIVIDYRKETEVLNASVMYNGPHFDPDESDDFIALAIIRNSVSAMIHLPLDEPNEDGFVNVVNLII